jgi:hypothetical protein
MGTRSGVLVAIGWVKGTDGVVNRVRREWIWISIEGVGFHTVGMDFVVNGFRFQLKGLDFRTVDVDFVMNLVLCDFFKFVCCTFFLRFGWIVVVICLLCCWLVNVTVVNDEL